MTAETDIAAIDDGGENTAAEVRTALSSVLARADAAGVSIVSRTSSFQSLTSGSETILTWQNEVVDELGIVNLGASTTLLTVQATGLYLVSYLITFAAEVTFDTGGGNARQGRVSVNGNPASLNNLIGYAIVPPRSGGTLVAATEAFPLSTNDTLQLNAFQSSGETLAITGQRLTVALLGD